MKITTILLTSLVFSTALLTGVFAARLATRTISLLSPALSGGKLIEKSEPTAELIENEVAAASPITLTPDGFPVTGWTESYADGTYLLNSEQLARSFRDIDFLEISTIDYQRTNEDGTYGIPIPPEGFVKAKQKLKFTRIAIGGRQLTFQTETINGVDYRFSGHFRTIDEYLPDQAMGELTGKLTKLKNGKAIASATVEFYMDGC